MSQNISRIFAFPRRPCKSAMLVTKNNQIILRPGPDQGQMTCHRVICKVCYSLTRKLFTSHLDPHNLSTMEPLKILSPGHVEFPVKTEDEYIPFSFRNPFQSSSCNIQTWAAHVQLATASLPTLTILPSAHKRFLGRYYGQNNHYFQTSLHIPNAISKDIRFYIATTINKQSPWTTLSGLPHPHKAPLVSNVCLISMR